MRFVKELLDRLLASLGLVLLSPVFAGLALWVVLESGRPVIFRQLRAGRHAKTFSMLKFRTMVPNAVELGRPVPAPVVDTLNIERAKRSGELGRSRPPSGTGSSSTRTTGGPTSRALPCSARGGPSCSNTTARSLRGSSVRGRLT